MAARTPHRDIVLQAIAACTDSCVGGGFNGMRPFHEDEKGRYLVLDSVGVACGLCFSALAIESDLSDELMGRIVEALDDVQLTLRTELLEIRANKNGSPCSVRGWCCDNAIIRNRIQSWVTSHSVKFLLGKRGLAQIQRRRDALRRYDCDYARHRREDGMQITDPNHGSPAPTLVLSQIDGVIDQEPDVRQSAPVFMLYGPPGTGKSTLVKSMAISRRWDFVRLSPSDFIVDGMEYVEQRARSIFSDLCQMKNCVILLDEMDSLLRSRASQEIKGTVMEHVVPAFLPKLQDLRDHAIRSDMAVFFVTNSPVETGACIGARTFDSTVMIARP